MKEKLNEMLTLNIFKSKLPNFLVYKKVYIGKEHGYKINNNGSLHLGRIYKKNGFFPSSLTLKKRSELKINGSFRIFSGFRITVNEDAILELGDGYINYGANISCFSHIKIGNGVIISQNVTIRDSDNHEIIGDNHKITKPIEICNHVWIGLNTTILKGVTIGEGSIIAAGSVVTKNIPPHSLAAGVPAKVIKSNVEWR